jgi:hypothetical protein
MIEWRRNDHGLLKLLSQDMRRKDFMKPLKFLISGLRAEKETQNFINKGKYQALRDIRSKPINLTKPAMLPCFSQTVCFVYFRSNDEYFINSNTDINCEINNTLLLLKYC